MEKQWNSPVLEPPAPFAKPNPSSIQQILVVDDHCDIRQLSTEVLTGYGYEAEAVGDGPAAWQALNANNYDLLITDQKMPRMSGMELLIKLRMAGMQLPVILTSSAVPPEELTRHEWLQPAITLPKPYTVAEFLRAVRESLRAFADTRTRKVPLSGWQNQVSQWVSV